MYKSHPKKGASSLKSAVSSSRIKQKTGKIAVVCSGGGITGGVYELGCLRALDDFLVGCSVTDFDIFVGTSAGAMIATSLAGGVRPDQTYKVLVGESKEFENFKRSSIFRLNYREFLEKILLSPGKITDALIFYLKHRKEMSLTDMVFSLGDLVPSGLLDNRGIRKFLEKNLVLMGKIDRFDSTDKELYLTAANLDTGERVVFGEEPYRHIPVTDAICASTALPGVFPPMRIDGVDYVDGGMRKTAHIDVAIKHGAELVICINPIVPVYNSLDDQTIPMLRGKSRYVRDAGLPSILQQNLYILNHSRLVYGLEHYRDKYPDVDILMVEPDREDFIMFFYNVFRFSARIIIAEHGFESMRKRIEDNFDEYAAIFRRNGIKLNSEKVDNQYHEMAASHFDLDIMNQILAARKPEEECQL